MAAVPTRASFGEELASLITKDQRIVVLTADLAGSVKTDKAARACPERCFDVGIAEANMMSIAAGLAASGKCVFAATYGVFAAGRAFDQIRQSIAYPHLNVKICGSHTGVAVGADGATHQAIFDISLMRCLPGMTVLQPADDVETRRMVDWAAEYEGPVYLRLGRGPAEEVHGPDYTFAPGKVDILKKGSRIALAATGGEAAQALHAAELLHERIGVDPTVANISSIKPLDQGQVRQLAEEHEYLFSIEDHALAGGMGSALAEILAEKPCRTPLVRIGLDETFGQSGTAGELLDFYGLSAEKIAERVQEVVLHG